MPCSQMISMNCRPPRATAFSSAAALPAQNAWMRNSPRWNIGCGTRVSTRQNAASSARPPTSPETTHGFVQPSAWPPYGWMPYVIAASSTVRPSANVALPHQSTRTAVPAPRGRAGSCGSVR
jgi:hypothetical protein